LKIEGFYKEYKLEPAAVDEISERIADFLQKLKTERANVLRIRLTVEEALLRWMDHFGSGENVSLSLGTSLRRPTIRISLRGEPYDPLTNSENDLGYWADSLTKTIGLKPTYSYLGDQNVIFIKLPKPAQDPAKRLVAAIVIGLLTGMITKLAIPADVLETLTGSYFEPVEEIFFRLLNIAAIPIIFLSVLSAVCGAGSVADKGKSNRNMIVHFIVLSTVIASVGAAAAVLFFNMAAQAEGAGSDMVGKAQEAILSIIPTDIMTPFQAGNSPQLIFMAVILGNALLVAGHQAENLVKIVDESHRVILLIADWVSGVTPLFVTLLIVLGMWDGSLNKVIDIWRPIVLFIIVTLVVLACGILTICIGKKVSVGTIIRKIRRPLWTAFRNASVKEAYSENYNCCVNSLGISKHLADYSIPLGLVLFQPIATTGLVVFTFYAARMYNIATPLVWVVSVLFLAVALQTASPPVSGVNLLAYAAIFSRVGIPEESLILAMVVDTLFCFIASAADQTMLEFELVYEADNTGQLDRDILIKDQK